MSGPFATATEFFEWIGNPVPDDMARVQALLDAASAKIRRYTGQILSEVTADVVVVQQSDRPVLILPERPVTAVTTVLVSGVAFTAFTFQANGILRRNAEDDWTLAATVTYNHGYTETSDEFKVLKAVCIEAAADAFLHDPSQSNLMGGAFAETVGWIPRVFLTQDHKSTLMDLGKVVVG